MNPETRRRVWEFFLSFLFGFGIVGFGWLIAVDGSVKLGSDEGEIVISLIQFVALLFPAVAIFSQALLQYSYFEDKHSARWRGMQIFSPEELRLMVFIFTFIGTTFLVIGLVALVFSLDWTPVLLRVFIPLLFGSVTVPGMFLLLLYIRGLRV